MIGIRAHVKLDKVVKALIRVRRFNVARTFREAKVPARVDQNDHDRKAMGPDGPWPPLAATTVGRLARLAVKKRKRRAYKLLGRLPRALVMQPSSRSLVVRSRVKWSMAHQAGARVGNGARLPRRQFLWISYRLREEVRKLFERALLRAWRLS